MIKRILFGAALGAAAMPAAAFNDAGIWLRPITAPSGHCVLRAYADENGILTTPPADAPIANLQIKQAEPVAIRKHADGRTEIVLSEEQVDEKATTITWTNKSTGTTMTLVVLDGANEGFNDPAPATPSAGNSGTTLGQQRLIAFQNAANEFGAALNSTIPVKINIQMNPLSCSTGSALLGQAGPTGGQVDFSGTPQAGQIYANALANAISGVDHNGAAAEITAEFNSNIDNGCFTPGGSWFYGIDGSAAPSGKIDFRNTVLHELGHGLGFLPFSDVTTGALNSGFSDSFIAGLQDRNSGKFWPIMTNGERAASATSNGNLVMNTPSVNAVAPAVVAGGKNGGFVRIYAPTGIASGSSVAHWDTVVAYTTGENELMEPFLTSSILPVGDVNSLTLNQFKDMGWSVNFSNLSTARNWELWHAH